MCQGTVCPSHVSALLAVVHPGAPAVHAKTTKAPTDVDDAGERRRMFLNATNSSYMMYMYIHAHTHTHTDTQTHTHTHIHTHSGSCGDRTNVP